MSNGGEDGGSDTYPDVTVDVTADPGSYSNPERDPGTTKDGNAPTNREKEILPGDGYHSVEVYQDANNHWRVRGLRGAPTVHYGKKLPIML